MIRVKDGVRLDTLVPQMTEILPIVDLIFGNFDRDCWITSTNDGHHMVGSLHYKNLAFDMRSKHLPDENTKSRVLGMLRTALGWQFDVIYEDPSGPNQHFHVERNIEKESI